MYSDKLKKVAIDLYKQIKSYRKVASILQISKSIVHYWVNYKYKPNKATKININQLCVYITKLISTNNFVTITEIKKNIYNKFRKNVSRSLIYTIITKKLKYSFKKVSKKMFNKNLKELMNTKYKFKNKYRNNYKNIICIDETYVQSNIYNKYGWQKKGERLIHYVKSNPIKYTITMAISCKGIIQYSISQTNANTSSYKSFMQQLCAICKNKQFLMDNVSFHKSKIIKEIINKSTNEIIYIPPYSPEFNPIEEVFSLLKRKIVKNNNKLIINKIISAIKNMKDDNFINYYKHSFD